MQQKINSLRAALRVLSEHRESNGPLAQRSVATTISISEAATTNLLSRYPADIRAKMPSA